MRKRVYVVKGRSKELIAKVKDNEVDGTIDNELLQIIPEFESGMYGIVIEEEPEIDKVLVVSTNIGLDHAFGIANGGYETYYAVMHAKAFPTIESEIDGYGFESIKKVWDLGDALEDGCNVIVFTDSGFGDLADWLRSKGYAVFGSDGITERLELDRLYFKKVCEKLGIKTPAYKVAKGIDGVKKAIEEMGKGVVKLSRFRGDIETFITDNPEEAEMRLRMSKLGIFDEVLTFVIEEVMDKERYVEIGVDAFFNGKEWLDIVFDTVEMKWTGNYTVAHNIEDSPWYDVLMKLEPYLKKNGYRGMFCMEGFWDGNKIYVTDPTPRLAYLCSYAYPRMINNYADIIVAVAKGEDIDIELTTKYSVQIGVYTDESDKWRIIESNDWSKTALRHAIKLKGKIWWVPIEDNVIATAIGLGNNPDVAIMDALRVVEGINAIASYHRGYEFKQYFGELRGRLREMGYDC